MNTDTEFHRALTEVVAEHDDPTPAIAVSAGCDSNALLMALLEVGVRPTMVSFTLGDRRSRDSLAAEGNAKRLGLTFQLVRLPSFPRALGALARETFDAGVRGKANIEALTPLRAVLAHVADGGYRTLWTGLLADCHFGVTRSEIIRYRNADLDTFDTYRRTYFATKGAAQIRWLTEAGDALGVTARAPYFDPRLCEVFLGKTWAELNKPRQKEAIRRFPGLDRLDVDKVRSNLQLGDSGVAETLARLVDLPDVNPAGHRSVIAIYNQWARGTA